VTKPTAENSENGGPLSTATLRWVDGNLMIGTDSNGHSIVIGKTLDGDGDYIGIKPSELLLLAASSCAAYDVVDILHKQREPLLDLKIQCSCDQLPDPPFSFTKVHLHYEVHGAVDKTSLERAIRLTEEKYCSVISTLRLAIPVTSDYEINP
jgi:putative redox protein